MSISFKKEACVFISLFSLLFTSCLQEPSKQNVENIPKHITLQEKFLKHLTICITSLDSLSQSNDFPKSKTLYLKARKEFKALEPILAFIDSENYKFLNQPNILKIEEEDATDIKIKEPTGFQVIEETLFADAPNFDQVKLHAVKTSKRLKLIKGNLNLNYIKEHHVLWMVRDQIIRTTLTGITGFDSPALENSLEEAKITYQAIADYLGIYQQHFSKPKLFDKWKQEIDAAILSLNGDFNTFNRYEFIKNHTHKALVLWNETVTDWNVIFPFEKAINNDAESLFSDSTFNISYFSSYRNDSLTSKKVALGKQLFFETNLSKSKEMSCASCHNPDKAYTDGLRISKNVTRNSPTLIYAALQKGFFYDNRAGSLEGQIVSVINNENEFHSDLQNFEEAIKTNSAYQEAFQVAYQDSINEENIRHAIASFIKSLTPFNSKFDRNINNFESSLTDSEINGFNLFNGKAKCATCHFAPVFNGTVPTVFKESEMELIGVPKTTDTINAEIDDDLGRFDFYKTPERKFFFKTPTVRNIAHTAPYMHNGVYITLEEVIDFYNKGGAAGLGIEIENQTLPPDPLNLTKTEIQDLIAFLNSLSDPLEENNEFAY